MQPASGRGADHVPVAVGQVEMEAGSASTPSRDGGFFSEKTTVAEESGDRHDIWRRRYDCLNDGDGALISIQYAPYHP